MTDADEIQRAVQRADLDELLRLVDALGTNRDWEGLASLRERCQRAHETGRQLWPAAAHATYRLALEAPSPWAAAVLVDDAPAFTLGPLPEVVAQSHTWIDLAPHVPRSAAAVMAAHERVVRGDDLTGVELDGPPVLDLPLALQPWEPDYALAEYRSHDADFPAPVIDAYEPLSLPTNPPPHGHDEASDALFELARAWTTQSNGRVDAVSVDGTAHDAIALLPPREVRGVEIDVRLAFTLMAWAGASGGAHGRRRGAAAGRFGAWWVGAACTGLLDAWPPDPEHLGEAVSRLRYLAWDPAESTRHGGWRLHLAIEDVDQGRAWAVAAVDAV
jgi:hypothetical protein